MYLYIQWRIPKCLNILPALKCSPVFSIRLKILCEERVSKLFFFYYELRSERKFFFWLHMVELSGNSTPPGLNQIGPNRPSYFCEPYISATMGVIIMKQIHKMRSFLDRCLSNFWTTWSDLASIKSIYTERIFNNFLNILASVTSYLQN